MFGGRAFGSSFAESSLGPLRGRRLSRRESRQLRARVACRARRGVASGVSEVASTKPTLRGTLHSPRRSPSLAVESLGASRFSARSRSHAVTQRRALPRATRLRFHRRRRSSGCQRRSRVPRAAGVPVRRNLPGAFSGAHPPPRTTHCAPTPRRTCSSGATWRTSSLAPAKCVIRPGGTTRSSGTHRSFAVTTDRSCCRAVRAEATWSRR